MPPPVSRSTPLEPSVVPNMDQTVARLPGAFLVHVPYEGPAEALRLAVELARAGGGEVVGVGAEPFTPAFELACSAFAPSALEVQLDEVPEHISAAALTFKLETRGLDRARWRTADTYPATVLLEESSAADWVLLTRPPKGASEASHPSITNVLLYAGVPMLVAPEGAAPLKASHVTVAWRDTREARLALTCAMPLLLMAQQVFLVAVREGAEDGTPSGLDRACQRLKGRGCAVDSEVISHEGESVARTLDAYAEARGSDVIVAGAYGHSRAQEFILGGVTRDLIAHSSRWVLFGH
jgi:nucleotide-binding universal stress UspA family protein